MLIKGTMNQLGIGQMSDRWNRVSGGAAQRTKVFGRGTGSGVEVQGSMLLWKQPQGQSARDQKASDALETQKRRAKSFKKKGRQFQLEKRIKMFFKVKPREQRGPWVQPDKSRQADEEPSSGARDLTAAEDKGSAYPALLSFVCWFHFFFPDWEKPMAVVCQV